MAIVEAERRKSFLEVGERCWLLLGTLLYVVDIIDVRNIFEGEPDAFRTYRVSRRKAPGSVGETIVEGDTHHRSDLFRCPSERLMLLERLREDAARLKDYRDQIARAQDDEPWPLGLV